MVEQTEAAAPMGPQAQLKLLRELLEQELNRVKTERLQVDPRQGYLESQAVLMALQMEEVALLRVAQLLEQLDQQAAPETTWADQED